MGNVSMSMEEQLNILLEEAEEELEQLEQDSLGYVKLSGLRVHGGAHSAINVVAVVEEAVKRSKRSSDG